MKKIKLISAILIAGAIVIGMQSGTVASAITDKEVQKDELSLKDKSKSIGYTFEDAPEDVKEKYRISCEEEGITVSESDNINVLTSVSTYAYENFIVWNEDSNIISSYYNKALHHTSFDTLVGYGFVTSGSPVHVLQVALRHRGHTLSIDGYFGNETRSSLIAAQSYRRLAVDGIAGPNTWRALRDID